MDLLMIIMILAVCIGMVRILRWAFRTMMDLAAIGFSLIVLFVVSNILVMIAFDPLWLALPASSLFIFVAMIIKIKGNHKLQ